MKHRIRPDLDQSQTSYLNQIAGLNRHASLPDQFAMPPAGEDTHRIP